MWNHILIGRGLSVVNSVIHAAVTGPIVVATRRIAAATDGLHVFVRMAELQVGRGDKPGR